jgi:Transmembrane family 220, helix
MKKIVFIIIGLVFLLFAYFQLNDPDPIRWVPIYLLPVFLCFWKMNGNGNKQFFYGLAVGYLVASILQFPPQFEGFLFGEMQMRSINIELARESGGLAIVALAMWFCGWWK